MKKQVIKLSGLIVLVLLMTGCTIFMSVSRPTGYIEGWVYSSSAGDIIILSSSNAPAKYRPVGSADIIVTSTYDGTFYGSVKTDHNGYFRMTGLSTGERRITVDSWHGKINFVTNIYRGANRLVYPYTSVGHYIFVGIDKYPKMVGIEDLGVSVNDAREMKDVLVVQNAMAGTFKELLDDKATKENIKNAILSAAANASTSDHLVFYFSGYADVNIWEEVERDPLDHLIPYDGIINNASLTQIESSMITDKDLANWLRQFPNDNITVILEAAYSDGFIDGQPTPRTQSIGGIELQALLDPGYTVLTATSNQKENIIPEQGSGNNHNLFTMLIIEGLRYGKDNINNDEVITAGELYDYVEKEMEKLNPEIFKDKDDYVYPSISGSRSTVIFRK